jgi:uncharacterized SAM-binding protein YcdF (DUF218 family)
MMSVLANVALQGFVWSSVSWKLFRWISQPENIAIPLIAIAGITYFLRSRRVWQIVGKPAVIVLVIYLLVVSPVAAKALSWSFDNRFLNQWYSARGSETAAQAIVVLGRGPSVSRYSTRVAADLSKVQLDIPIFASGVTDSPRIVSELKWLGVAPERLQGENCSRTTEENAAFTARLLQRQGIQTILLVTDAAHMPRAMLTFRSYGFKVIPRHSRLPEDYRASDRSLLAFREYMGLVSYGLMGRFQSRSAQDGIPASVMTVLNSSQCQVRG